MGSSPAHHQANTSPETPWTLSQPSQDSASTTSRLAPASGPPGSYSQLCQEKTSPTRESTPALGVPGSIVRDSRIQLCLLGGWQSTWTWLRPLKVRWQPQDLVGADTTHQQVDTNRRPTTALQPALSGPSQPTSKLAAALGCYGSWSHQTVGQQQLRVTLGPLTNCLGFCPTHRWNSTSFGTS